MLNKLIILLCVLTIFIPKVVNAEFVYQENPDQKANGTGIDCSNYFDGNWSTFASATPGISRYCYTNYTKYPSADGSSLWTVKDAGAKLNLSLPPGCWNYDATKLLFQAESQQEAVCLHGNTKINTPNGIISISELKAGDGVYSYDLDNNKVVVSFVEGVSNRGISFYYNKYYVIYYGMFPFYKSVKATWNHYFYLTNGSYVKAEDLSEGDVLLNINSRKMPIKKIKVVEEHNDIVWDIRVNDYHNFYAEGVLVHNPVGATWYCYNTSSVWSQLRNFGAGYAIYDDGMEWNIGITDTCTAPADGDWNVDCADECDWTTAQNVPDDLYLTGTGTVHLSAPFTFTGANQRIIINSGCTLDITSGGQIG